MERRRAWSCISVGLGLGFQSLVLMCYVGLGGVGGEGGKAVDFADLPASACTEYIRCTNYVLCRYTKSSLLDLICSK